VAARPDTELITVTATDRENGAAARVESTTHAFTAWASTRLPWRDHVTVTVALEKPSWEAICAATSSAVPTARAEDQGS
jgi:hypothetical protein